MSHQFLVARLKKKKLLTITGISQLLLASKVEIEVLPGQAMGLAFYLLQAKGLLDL